MIALSFLAGCLQAAQLSDQSPVTGYIDKFYRIWNTPPKPGSDGINFLQGNFESTIPDALKDAVLDGILQRAWDANPRAYRVIGCVMGTIRNFGNIKYCDETVRGYIYKLAQDPSWRIRENVIGILVDRNNNEDESLFTKALSDPSDEVRAEAIDGLLDRPDGKAKLEKYVKDHGGDSNYSLSVTYAKAGLAQPKGVTLSPYK